MENLDWEGHAFEIDISSDSVVSVLKATLWRGVTFWIIPTFSLEGSDSVLLHQEVEEIEGCVNRHIFTYQNI